MKRIPRTSTSEISDDWHHYLPVPSGAGQSSFYITSVGRSTVNPGQEYPLSRHPKLYHFSWEDGRVLPEFGLVFITKGRGKFESHETRTINVSAGQVILVFPDVWHRYRPDRDTGWAEKWIKFDGAMALQMLEEGIISPKRPVCSPANFPEAEARLDRLFENIARSPTTNPMLNSLNGLSIITSALTDAPVYTSRFRVEENDSSDQIVVAALDYIWTQGHNVLSVPEVASAISVTRRTLERHMLATLGHGILEEIINCRFSRAERLLRSTHLPLKVIVDLAGFGSMENMRQVFLSRTKMSPLAYRQHHSGAESQGKAAR